MENSRLEGAASQGSPSTSLNKFLQPEAYMSLYKANVLAFKKEQSPAEVVPGSRCQSKL